MGQTDSQMTAISVLYPQPMGTRTYNRRNNHITLHYTDTESKLIL